MKKIVKIFFAALFLIQNLEAQERMCFGQIPISDSSNLQAKITISESTAYSKCKRFYSYYAKHVDFSQSECINYEDQLTSNKGYAPLGVFFRGWESTPKVDISKYVWKISGPLIENQTPPVVATYEAFNAAYVFKEPGEYEVELTVTDKNGSVSTAYTNVSVWERDGKTYYVDSVIGDDRYNGLAEIPDNNCNVKAKEIGACAGPWKTATRALGELSPFDVTNFPEGEYSADNICLNKETVDIVRYNQGNFKTFRSSSFLAEEAKTDADGNYLPAVPTDICTNLVGRRETSLRPGDQVLFKRGQFFKLETGYDVITSYTATNNGVLYNYERLDQRNIIDVGHWSKALGVHFGAYGVGDKPQIKNSGKVSSDAIALNGYGMFRLSFSDIVFNLSSDIVNPLNSNRAVFVEARGNPVGLVFDNIDVTEVKQGIIVNSTNAQGLFIFDSSFYDSEIVQLYTQLSHEDVALVGNKFDYSANHLIYSDIDSGLIFNNILSRPAYGRTALRLTGGRPDKPNRYVWIGDNEISGWKDPRTSQEYGRAFADGTRYNYLLVQLSPNVSKDLFSHDIWFVNNKVSDAESFMGVGAVENLMVKDNEFSTQDSYFASRVALNLDYAKRPLKNINFINNKFLELSEQYTLGLWSSIFKLTNYYQTKCSDQFNHEKINISNNIIYLPQSNRRVFSYAPLKQGKGLLGEALPDLTVDQAQSLLSQILTFDNNTVYTNQADSPMFVIGGDYRASDPSTSLLSLDWLMGFDGVSSTGGEYRLFNLSSNFLSPYNTVWSSATTTAVQDLLNVDVASLLTWDELILFAQEKGLSPEYVSTLILDSLQPPSVNGGIGYKPDSEKNIWDIMLSPFKLFSDWVDDLFSITGTEDVISDWEGVKKLADNNNVSAGKIRAQIQDK